MSRLHEGSRIESVLTNNEYAEKLGRRQQANEQNDSMETLMRKARNELKNQNASNSAARGNPT